MTAWEGRARVEASLELRSMSAAPVAHEQLRLAPTYPGLAPGLRALQRLFSDSPFEKPVTSFSVADNSLVIGPCSENPNLPSLPNFYFPRGALKHLVDIFS